MPVAGIASAQVHTDNPVATVRRRDRNLLAELLAFMSFAFADTHHFRFVQTVQLLPVFPMLSMKPFAKPQQFTEGKVRPRHFATRRYV
jgi:hypothetical protein